VQCELH